MFRINRETKTSQPVEEVEFSTLGLKERDDIQEWIAANPSILGENLLVVTKEFSDFDRTKERLDLLAVDDRGRLVIVELKRDDSGVDVHWQAIKYASYLHRAEEKQIVDMLARHRRISEDDARKALEEHLGADNLASLNNDQRIILASHRFAPEVTSAVLWINKQVERALITCVQFRPYHDGETESLYLQANTIIPAPGTESYRIGIGAQEGADTGRSGLTHPDSEHQAELEEVKGFFAKVEERAAIVLPSELRPDKRIRYGRWRYTHIWYSRTPWNNWRLCYRVALDRTSKVANLGLLYDERRADSTELAALESLTSRLVLGENQKKSRPWPSEPHYVWLTVECQGESLSDEFVRVVANALKHIIETSTPEVEALFQENSEAESV